MKLHDNSFQTPYSVGVEDFFEVRFQLIMLCLVTNILKFSGEEQGPEANQRREERKKKKEEKLVRAEKRASKGKSSGGGEKRERKTKRTKLPGQPKRNQSAYFLWMNENREKVKTEHPGLSLPEFAKKAGELWRELSDKSVSRYFDTKLNTA